MFEPMNVLYQQQSSSIPYITAYNMFARQNLDEVNRNPQCQSISYTPISLNNNNESNTNNDWLSILDDDFFTELPTKTQFGDISIDPNSIIALLNDQSQSDPIDMFNNLFVEPQAIDNAILTGSISQDNKLITKKVKVHQNQSTTVTPINYTSNPNLRKSGNIIQMPSDPTYPKKQLLQQDLIKSRRIKIKCQPRSKFRPRTQNESRTSSHYIRCEDGTELEYPAIHVFPIWACHSKINIIEVALMDIEKQPHPYSIVNKTSKSLLAEQVFIVKQDEPNILYFRLTNEDFLSGFKTFMMELIKSKQNGVITKNVIRTRKLHQSMLRFTRIYQDENGKFQRDIDSEEYSCVMTENYGDISVEHMGPRYGSMYGQEMVFIVFKGRIVKDDISIIIFEQTTGWSQNIEKFTLNGSTIYFTMPSFPYPNLRITRVIANINIYFKKQKIHEANYLYMSTLDQELTDINLNGITSDLFVSMTSNSLLHDMGTNNYPVSLMPKTTSKNKSKKRLNRKLLSF